MPPYRQPMQQSDHAPRMTRNRVRSPPRGIHPLPFTLFVHHALRRRRARFAPVLLAPAEGPTTRWGPSRVNRKSPGTPGTNARIGAKSLPCFVFSVPGRTGDKPANTGDTGDNSFQRSAWQCKQQAGHLCLLPGARSGGHVQREVSPSHHRPSAARSPAALLRPPGFNLPAIESCLVLPELGHAEPQKQRFHKHLSGLVQSAPLT